MIKMRGLFSEKFSSNFCIEMAQTYTDILKMAIKVHVCESAFSALLAMKPKTLNRIDAIHDMRVALSKVEQNKAELIAKEGSPPLPLIQ